MGIKQYGEPKRNRLSPSRLLLPAFALAITFRIQAVHVTLTNLTGINNIALLFSYCTAIMAITIVVKIMYVRLFAARRFPWLFAAAAAVLALLATFPSIANSPDIYASGLPPARAILRFRLVFYVYSGWLSGLTAVRYHQFRQDSRSPAARLRWTMGKYGMVTAVAYCTGRTLEAGLLWILLTPETHTGFNLLHIFNAIVLAISTIMWVLFFVGGALFHAITHLTSRLDQMKTLRDLRQVGAIAAAYGGKPMPKQPVPWWLCIDSQLQIHQTIISILDNRRLMALAHHAKNGSDMLDTPSKAQQQAANVYALLESAEHRSQTDYQSLVNAYRQLARLADQQFSNQRFSWKVFKLVD